MGSIRPLTDREVLSPEDIRVAASALEAALTFLNHPQEPATRETLARYIVHRALHGERDPIRLRDGALAHLREPSSTRSG
jgi:hypothetical protein